jgi:hypothetical protein
MKRKKGNLLIRFALTVAGFATLAAPGLAQNASSNPKPINTTSRMLYHNGAVLTATPYVYIVWYGNWPIQTYTQIVLTDFVSNLGYTPYFRINQTYSNGSGQVPSGDLFYGGAGADYLTYAHGNQLTATDIQGIITDQFANGGLVYDPAGIYIVAATADVSSNSTGFCTPDAPPHHGFFAFNGAQVPYGFLGHPARCPSIAAPQFNGGALPTPNGDLAGDAMASTLAEELNEIVTDPLGDAWYDRYGLENAEKCRGTFGTTYLMANGARANMHLSYNRDYLIPQNWVNDRKGRCALFQ